jgi:hypothetical protein
MIAALLMVLGAGTANAQVSFDVRVGAPPPPRAVRVVPARPGPGFVWVNGYWYPVGNRYVWRQGYWARPPYVGARWYAPRYDGARFYSGDWNGNRGRFDRDGGRFDRGGGRFDRDRQGDRGRFREGDRRR